MSDEMRPMTDYAFVPADKALADALDAAERMAQMADGSVSRIVGWDGNTDAYHLTLAVANIRAALARSAAAVTSTPGGLPGGPAASGDSDDSPIEYPDLRHAWLGVCERFGQPPVACYDYGKVIAGYMADGMTEEEAVEFFEFNVLGAWVGDRTPCFVRTDVTPEEMT